jgi:hypothetical protein
MELWTKDESGARKWVPSPENVASRMLQNFLAGKFSSRIEAFTEVGAGAGRIDLYVLLRGGLRIIVELKMLGSPYSSTYAFSGIEQITHYMDNRECRLGYLVLFDARTRDWGLHPVGRADAPNTVHILFVDVRHTIKP